MQYKVYNDGKEYRICDAQTQGFGDVAVIVEDEYIKLRSNTGEEIMIKSNYGTGNWDQQIDLAIQSGDAFSAFYINPEDLNYHQTGYNSFYEQDNLFIDSQYIRIWKFDGYSDLYDPTDISWAANSENECKKVGGVLIGIIKFIQKDGKNYWRLIDPTIPQYGGTYIDLPTMQDTLYVSGNECGLESELGVYYTFESGDEGVGFYLERGTNVIQQSYQGWFGSIYPEQQDRIHIYHCGEGYYEYCDYFGLNYNEPWQLPTNEEREDWFVHQFSTPTIIEYNGTKWVLIQEGEKNDF